MWREDLWIWWILVIWMRVCNVWMFVETLLNVSKPKKSKGMPLIRRFCLQQNLGNYSQIWTKLLLNTHYNRSVLWARGEICFHNSRKEHHKGFLNNKMRMNVYWRFSLRSEHGWLTKTGTKWMQSRDFFRLDLEEMLEMTIETQMKLSCVIENPGGPAISHLHEGI